MSPSSGTSWTLSSRLRRVSSQALSKPSVVSGLLNGECYCTFICTLLSKLFNTFCPAVFDIAIDGNKIYNSLHAAHYYYAKKEYGCCGMQLANTLQALKSLSSAAENAFESLMSNSTLARQPKKEKTVSPEPDSTDVTTIAIGASAFVAAAALLAVAIRRRRNAASALENGSAQEDASVVAADASNGL